MTTVVRVPTSIASARTRSDGPRAAQGNNATQGGPGDSFGPLLPAARGPLTRGLFAHLRHPSRRPLPTPNGPMLGDDGQLALHCIYELAYRGFAGVADDMEWDPIVLRLRRQLEQVFLDDLGRFAPVGATAPESVPGVLLRMAGGDAGDDDGSGLSAYVAENATLAQLREVCIHRSAYQAKEADPHTWGIPRLFGEAKAAMVQIQADEYGGGERRAMHAELFAMTMAELGLDPAYGSYLDVLPGETLATGNLISLFGLHRRWRGALVGHLALFEMSSVGPMGRYSAAVDRLVGSERARRFFDVHVQADAVHERIALERMVVGLLADEPHLASDVVFGAAALTTVERRFSAHVLGAWAQVKPSLRPQT